MKRAAVFFDRDNTLIANDGYLGDPAGVILIDGAADAVARVRGMGFVAITFSNQSGVARGLFTEEAVHAVNARLDELLQDQDEQAVIGRHEFCPYHPEGVVEKYRVDSELRKPKPGMIFQAAERLDLDLSRSWVIGDGPLRDIEAGKTAGCRTIFFRDPNLSASSAASESSTVTPDFVVASLKAAVDIIVDATLGPLDVPAIPSVAETKTEREPLAIHTPMDKAGRQEQPAPERKETAMDDLKTPEPVEPAEVSHEAESAIAANSIISTSQRTPRITFGERVKSGTFVAAGKKSNGKPENANAGGVKPQTPAAAAMPRAAKSASPAKAPVAGRARKPTFAERVKAGTFVPTRLETPVESGALAQSEEPAPLVVAEVAPAPVETPVESSDVAQEAIGTRVVAPMLVEAPAESMTIPQGVNEMPVEAEAFMPTGVQTPAELASSAKDAIETPVHAEAFVPTRVETTEESPAIAPITLETPPEPAAVISARDESSSEPATAEQVNGNALPETVNFPPAQAEMSDESMTALAPAIDEASSETTVVATAHVTESTVEPPLAASPDLPPFVETPIAIVTPAEIPVEPMTAVPPDSETPSQSSIVTSSHTESAAESPVAAPADMETPIEASVVTPVLTETRDESSSVTPTIAETRVKSPVVMTADVEKQMETSEETAATTAEPQAPTPAPANVPARAAASTGSSAKKLTFAERVKAGTFQAERTATTASTGATAAPERPRRVMPMPGDRPQTQVNRVVESLTAVRPTQPIPPEEQLEPVLQSILEELRLTREGTPQSDFSTAKLVAGIVQVLVLPALFFAFLHREVAADVQSMLMLATSLLETLVIALLLMGRS